MFKFFVFTLLLIISCEDIDTVNDIINKSIVAHGVNDSISVSFVFRGSNYHVYKNKGTFKYSKQFNDTLDVLSNNGFKRIIDDKQLLLSSKDSLTYSNRLNSVIYFSILPAPLCDEAVQATLLEMETIENKSYHKIKITFNEMNGGTDFEDEFIYWINSKTFLIDYFAYQYHTNGGGSRFRSVTNRHYLNGIILSDYDNFKSNEKSILLTDYLKKYTQSGLTKVSEIKLENVKNMYQFTSTKK